MLNIHRTLLNRLAASWVAVSLGIGGGLYIYGLEKIDDQLVELATREADSIPDKHVALLNDPRGEKTTLDQLAGEFLRKQFIVAELYDRQHKLLTEKTNPNYAEIEEKLKRNDHSFPQDGQPHYDRLSVDDKKVLRVMVPLRDTSRDVAGYFEGVFLIDAETLQRLHRDLVVTLLIALAAVLATTLVVYPVVLSLNRNVIKFSRDLLMGNIELMEVLGGAIAKRDSDTNIHNYRVSIYAVRLADAAGLDKDTIRDLIAGAFLHDVGKIGISDNILLKPARLTAEEFAVMKTHVTLGVDILTKANWLQSARDVVEYHHEKFDGSGYMRGLKGETIPINARIFSIVDVFDALTSERPYKKPMPLADALAILQRDAGTHFDPRLTGIFAGIAEPLYREISAATDTTVEKMLQALIARYFFPA